MAIIKCKMCGGDLKLINGSSVCECEYCGTRQTVPSADNEKKMTLFTRASRLLRNCEFDKASGVFETIVADFPEEAEAYWGLVLCKYGIEYVDDPATGKKIPTCHRSGFDSVLDDANFEQACENADAIARRVYRDEARQIEELRINIIEVSGKEDPYDIFISYKETDENGERTLDSVIAQDIYSELTEKGYRVFFSRISLESKLGTEYEPYIFAALNSAKVMLVVGTDYENFDAVWVKNEWSRFLKLIASGQKKTLIPVFKNMDAYDMPKEFAKLSAQDMGKVGAMQDLIRGVEKLVPLKKPEATQVEKVTEKVIVQQQSEGSMKTDAAIKRGKLALEDGEWEKAKQYFDQALTLDAECAEAYFGIALAELQARDPESYIRKAAFQTSAAEKLSIPEAEAHIRKTAAENAVLNFLSEGAVLNLYRFDRSYSSTLKRQQEIQNQVRQQIESNRNLSRALRFAQGEEKNRIEGFMNTLYHALQENVEKARKQEEENRNRTKQNYEKFLKEADQKAQDLNQEARTQQTKIYQNAVSLQGKAKTVSDYQAAIVELKKTPGFQDTAARIQSCEKEISDIQERDRREKAEQERKAAAKKRKAMVMLILLVVTAVVTYLLCELVILPEKQRSMAYREAAALYGQGNYDAAILEYESLGDYKDSQSKMKEVTYQKAASLYSQGKYDEAFSAYSKLQGYKDVDTKLSTDKELRAAAHRERILPYMRIGNIVTFGNYEQDNNRPNGKESVEWLVLANVENKSLLISHFALDSQKYMTNYQAATWKTCSLRTWLNSTFIDTAFSDEEKRAILTTTVDVDKTENKIYLLSTAEAKKYFDSESSRSCKPTAYAVSQGCNTDEDGNCGWRLRSIGRNLNQAEMVGANGNLGSYSCGHSEVRAIRPVFWIDLESDYFDA